MKRVRVLGFVVFFAVYEMIAQANAVDVCGLQAFRAEVMGDGQPSDNGRFPDSFRGFRSAFQRLSR